MQHKLGLSSLHFTVWDDTCAIYEVCDDAYRLPLGCCRRRRSDAEEALQDVALVSSRYAAELAAARRRHEAGTGTTPWRSRPSTPAPRTPACRRPLTPARRRWSWYHRPATPSRRR